MNNVGNFFVKLGKGIKKGFFAVINWVKNTAWVQPLLIVGVIFGVILCIKPVINWVGGLFNPDETFEFYRDHTVDDMTKLYNNYIKNEDGTVIVVFYGDNDTKSADVEKTIKNYYATTTNVKWYCVDIDDDSKDEAKKAENQTIINDAFQNTFFDEYAAKYNEMPEDMKSSDYAEFTIANDDTTNVKIPSPLFVRYDSGVLTGVRIGLSSSNTLDELELFVEGTKEEWEDGKLKA